MQRCSTEWRTGHVRSVRLAAGAYLVEPDDGFPPSQVWRRRSFVLPVGAEAPAPDREPGVVLSDNPVRCSDLSAAKQLALVGAYQTRKPVEIVAGSGTGFLVRLYRRNLPTSSAVLQVAVYRPDQSVTEPVMPEGYVLYRQESSVFCVPAELVSELANGTAELLAA